MKKLIFTFGLIISLLSITNLYAQKDAAAGFQGTITYTITVEGELDAMSKAQMPTEMVQTFKGTKIKTEQKSSMGNQTIISDNTEMTSVILLDMMGNKMAIKQSKEDTEKAVKEMPTPKITYTEETKDIAGYKCKKVTLENEGEKMDAYYTEEILVTNPNMLSMFKDIKGVLLEFAQVSGGITLKMTAKEVKKGKIKDSIFEIPSDYKIMTPEELKSMFGQ
jgi:GLPGLI family protein